MINPTRCKERSGTYQSQMVAEVKSRDDAGVGASLDENANRLEDNGSRGFEEAIGV